MIKIFQSLKHDTWVKPFMVKYKKLLVMAIVLGFLTFFCGGALMFTSGYLISRAASIPENILLIYVPIVLTRAFGIARPVLRYIERLTSHNWVLKMTSDLRKKLYLSLEKEAIFFNERYRLGDILGLLSEDIGHLQNLYLRTIFPMLIALSLYVFIVIALGMFSLWFALVMALLLFVVIVLVPMVSVLRIGAAQEMQKAGRNELYVKLTDNVVGVSDWVFSGRGHDFVASYEAEEANLRKVNEKILSFQRLRNFIVEVLFGFIVVILLLWTGAVFVGNHGGAANWIAAFALCVFPLVDAFAPLSDAATETNIYADSINRLNELPEVEEQETFSMEMIYHEGDPMNLNVRNVHFQYESSEEEVLKGLNLTFRDKEKVAILGKSGSGKSTLARLLRGDLKPTSGEVDLNDMNVVDINPCIHQVIGVMHQNPYLFHTTILNNLRIGNENASVEDCWRVLELVGLKSMVESLPEGIQTMVDEAGLRFSGGERHRLALARILLQNVPIVILDEPTVGLDPITENQLLDSFFTALEGKTVIWITHHLLGVEQMDRVLFIEDGVLELDGTPTELAQTSTRYQALMRLDKGY
ncbi:MAG: thiol reductant ABC exporter subunit CydC [Lactobacillales bacterium]|jgi:ATP-binding cassette subfamily C protein CydC|nr:thiol reductant ABC exporter subunit CydC [Lactobacillales bacterium]